MCKKTRKNEKLGERKVMLTKVKEQQDGLITLIKQDHCFVSNNNAPLRSTGG